MEPKADPQRRNRRILVKLSGEALMGDSDYGIDPAFIKRLAAEIVPTPFVPHRYFRGA